MYNINELQHIKMKTTREIILFLHKDLGFTYTQIENFTKIGKNYLSYRIKINRPFKNSTRIKVKKGIEELIKKLKNI
jgi:hypothetical protein